jgi:hypothetical protein
MIHLTEEQFDLIYRTLELASDYTEEQVEDLVVMEHQAWVLVQEIRRTAAPAGSDPLHGPSPTPSE